MKHPVMNSTYRAYAHNQTWTVPVNQWVFFQRFKDFRATANDNVHEYGLAQAAGTFEREI